MLRKYEVINAIYEGSVVAVLRGNENEVMTTARAAIKGGIKTIELTMTVPNAFDVLRELKSEFESQSVYIGMGTVLDVNSTVNAIQAGADFIVTPHFDLDIINVSQQYQTLVMPGAFTITEMVNALRAGCEILKLFPADLAGPNHIKNVKGPLPQVNIMPTGGVNESNIEEWIKAGAVAVGVGSNLTKAGGSNLDPQKISDYASMLVKKVQQAKMPMSGVVQ
ncbi:bifunctional 4-hydroxy-2-oxoglutarate aldolase/2-dehydro-3-deoxy-phosphogluconate aldolase [Priestia megaterium]|uniref:bifunctional 4-hydroxy-2-oxoglutarate aldolase/2-dehydro-3-deoxy-phosphogluconate aldolase n=1 Tax=Priestia megaterium TaxID=1404 RepID=UPI0013F7D216|nr:bifunctional 4-hydroxy-2-oxoglutarate aldolase/2-dehydro-3-deoxy-phosphogluconate aldolase [Priestia megaterium]NGY70110.1 bifunctional 4-hydroxy-2-oxoglutarate aldolase/2-dehydro-3-deoxy-phosphogluconate aldolase [Priestia megaterium]